MGTFDDDWRPMTMTKSSPPKKQRIGVQNESPSKYKKEVRFKQVNQRFFHPFAQLYHLNSWPSSLRLLSPAHLVLLFLASLSMAVGGCLAYPLGFRTVGLLLWLLSSLMLAILAVLAAAIMVKKDGKGGFGRILTRV